MQAYAILLSFFLSLRQFFHIKHLKMQGDLRMSKKNSTFAAFFREQWQVYQTYGSR